MREEIYFPPLHEAKCLFKKLKSFPFCDVAVAVLVSEAPFRMALNAPPETAIALTHKLKNAARATRAAITLVDLTTTCT